MTERISQLMDGELDRDEAEPEFRRLQKDPALSECWAVYHLIGDTLREPGAVRPGIVPRVSARLAAEPTVLAPGRARENKPRRMALSVAATVAAVAMVGWIAFETPRDAQLPASGPVAQVAPQAQQPVAQVASMQGPSVPNEFLMLHQEVSPSGTIQGLAPFVRTVAESREAGR